MNQNESRVLRIMSALAAGVVLAGCANSPARVESSEDLLSRAGFQSAMHGDPAYAATAPLLRPYRFGHRTVDGVTTYYFLDTMNCACLYSGTAQNWAAYKVDLAAKMHMDAEKYLEQDDMPANNLH
ncbi:MAG TPA: hypothetical protein VFE41_21160 [Acetobacteraceae bacterium]|nr:hypothetical protein [Acetobacteraceae bacterium]